MILIETLLIKCHDKIDPTRVERRIGVLALQGFMYVFLIL
jgi:hypothetical protein